MQEIETTLYHLPKPSKQHLDHLEQLLGSLRQAQGLTTKDIRAREEVAAKVEAVLKDVVEGEFGAKSALIMMMIDE